MFNLLIKESMIQQTPQLRSRSAGSSTDKKDDDVWVVHDSLPYGNDFDQTLPMTFDNDLPAGVGKLLQNEVGQSTMAEKHSDSQSLSKNDCSVEEVKQPKDVESKDKSIPLELQQEENSPKEARFTK